MHYGQAITWGPYTAPTLFTGTTNNYSYRDAVTRQLEADARGHNEAAILHSRKAEISFDAKVTDGSTNFLLLSDDAAAIAIAGIAAGFILCSRAVERWDLGQRKTASISATHYMEGTMATPPLAATTLSAFTPSQTGLNIVFPGAKLVYSTYGLGHASGVVQGLTVEQQLTLREDDPSPDGKILGVEATGYLRTIQLRLLARTDLAAKPAIGSVLAVTGAPDHASGYRIESVNDTYADSRGRMYEIGAFWIPAGSF